MATFADLMALLLAFFVLLFSFSELDKAKYKEVAGSMRDAFGVQQEISVRETPKGLNVIAREFSPGIPQETPLNEIRQFTTEDSLPYPVLFESKEIAYPRAPGIDERILADKHKLEKALKPELDADLIELEMEDDRIIVRIKEKGVFPSGSDRLIASFEPIIRHLGDTLVETSGKILVAGHTDNIPIENSLFRSNWELSMGRALTVAQVFFGRSDTLAPRTQLEAYAEFRPVDSNETAEGRARNRRVEISLVYGRAPSEPASSESQENPSSEASAMAARSGDGTPSPEPRNSTLPWAGFGTTSDEPEADR